jgi:hypothetical protein
VIGAAQIDDLLLDLGRRAQGHVLGARLLLDEALFAVLLVGVLPLVVAPPPDPEAPRRQRHVAAFLA